MKRKMMLTLLAASLVLGTLGGNMNSKASENDGEITEIIMQWPSLGTTGDGLVNVENALNEMLERDCGVHLILEPVLYSDLLTQTTLAVSSGEQLDICLEVGTGIGPYVSNGLIYELDELVAEYGQDIAALYGDGLNAGNYNGQLYGIPNSYVTGDGYGFYARKDLLDKYDITIDPDKEYSLEELSEIFDTIKTGEGDNFYIYMPSAHYNPLSCAAYALDFLGGTGASGALMLNRGFEDTTIYNLYATEEYEAYANRMYDWAKKGYVSSDAATNSEDFNVLFSNGNYLGTFAETRPGRENELFSQLGTDLVIINTVLPYTMTSSTVVSWQVPITSVSPEKAMTTLNYIYSNAEAATLLQFGIEGVDYNIVEQTEEGTVITYASEDMNALSYYQPFTVYGDALTLPVVYPASPSLNREDIEWHEAIPVERCTPAFGYIFNMDSVSEEYNAVYAVISQYAGTIDCGASDPADILPEFLAALEDAGIDTVIAENQSQLDAWLSEQ